MSFNTLGLSTELLKTVSEQGYNEPHPIQQEAIPAILGGCDIMAAAQTGTGKTAGFTLPLLHHLSENVKRREQYTPRALILVPTRELADQVAKSVWTYSKNLQIRSTVVYGGVPIRPQIIKLRNGIDVLVATPGRLLDLVGQNKVNLSRIEILVLDEADRILDMGFINDIRKIFALLPEKRQSLLFSATFSNQVKKLANGLLNSPQVIQVSASNSVTENVTQIVHPVDSRRKTELLSSLITSKDWNQILVFTRTKIGADRIAQKLNDDGIKALKIPEDNTAN